jgi:hypothetical protein
MESAPLNPPTDGVVTIRDESGRFLPGTKPPPAKPGRLGGRAMALKLLDKIIARDDVQARIGAAMLEEVMANPMRFFRTIIMPLLPQDVKINLGEDGAIQWVSLSTMFPTKAKEKSTAPVIDVSESSVVVEGGEKRSALPPNS